VSLRARIALAAAGAVAVAVVLGAAATYVLVRGQLRGEVDDALRGRARAVEAFGLRLQRPGPFPSIPVDPGVRLGGAGSYLQVVSSNGGVSSLSRVRPAAQVPVTAQTLAVARGDRDAFFGDAVIAGTHVRVLTAPAAPGLAVQVVRPLDEVDRTLRRLRLILFAVVAGGIALAAALGVAVTRATLAPVRRLTSAAEDVSQTLDLSHRIETDGGDELGRLAGSFNRMLETLERSVGAQRQLVADASHELRTPITSIRMNVELLARKDALSPSERERVLAATLVQLDEMTTLVAEISELARGDEQRLDDDDVRLDQIVEDAVERVRGTTGSIEFRTTIEPTVVRGVPSRLTRAVANLLDNAAKWSPPGGTVEVTLSGGELVVRDHGPGVEPEDVPHVFDRFYRSRAARSNPGSGLGLAIVRQVTDDHGGTAVVENAPDGGAVFRLRFPVLLTGVEPAAS
jgi:two-component system, OmpR family, sensor histidine kinase MprB